MGCTIIPIIFILCVGIVVFGILINIVNKDYALGNVSQRPAAVLTIAFIGIILFLLFSIYSIAT